MLNRALIFVDGAALERRLIDLLQAQEIVTDTVGTSSEIATLLARESRDLLLVTNRALKTAETDLLAVVTNVPDAPDVIVLTDQEDPEERAGMLARGAVAVLARKLSPSALRKVVDAVLLRRSKSSPATIDRTRPQRKPQLSDFRSVGNAMKPFVSVVQRVVESDTTLLILGETGSGKEHLAQAIHNEGKRREEPFVAVACAALSENLLESELFGHEEGSFIGATRARRSCFELAHGGTLFLDEVGEMPLHLQAKLLRVLQDRRIARVGSETSVPVDVRVMASTSRDIQADVDAGQFRKDLFYRLGVLTLHVPPLRERQEEIPMIVEHYLDFFSSRMTHRAHRISREALDTLIAYDWPGNVRELMNVIERALLLCPTEEIRTDDLPADVRGEYRPRRNSAHDGDPVQLLLESGWKDRQLSDVLQDLERVYLQRLLKDARGRVGITAARAGIDPRVLYEKMKRHKLNKADYK